jgi:hypothetical protein
MLNAAWRYHATLCGLVSGIHVLTVIDKEGVDGRDKPGHDGERSS